MGFCLSLLASVAVALACHRPPLRQRGGSLQIVDTSYDSSPPSPRPRRAEVTTKAR